MSESPGRLVKEQLSQPLEILIPRLTCSPRIGISSKFPGDRTPLLQGAHLGNGRSTALQVMRRPLVFTLNAMESLEGSQRIRDAL